MSRIKAPRRGAAERNLAHDIGPAEPAPQPTSFGELVHAVAPLGVQVVGLLATLWSVGAFGEYEPLLRVPAVSVLSLGITLVAVGFVWELIQRRGDDAAADARDDATASAWTRALDHFQLWILPAATVVVLVFALAGPTGL